MTTVFETVPVGADTETTVAGTSSGSGTIDLSIGETEVITFDFTTTFGDAPPYFETTAAAAGTLVFDSTFFGTATFTITHAEWVSAGSPATVFFEATGDFVGFASYVLNITCFAAGTSIATPGGFANVEHLQPGDLVCTFDGRDVAVRWVGHQSVNAAMAEVPERMQLVRITAGSLGDGLPRRDLTVTADHAMYLDGLLINASALVSLSGVAFVPLAETGAAYTVYHIETDAHDILLAEGSPTESFVDAVTRAAFDNHDEYIALYGADRIVPELPIARIASRRLLPKRLASEISSAKAA